MGSSSQSGFQMRVTQLDHIMTPPIPGFDVCYSPFDSEPIQQVPVIRIWGATPGGQTTCLHLHRVRVRGQRSACAHGIGLEI